MRMCDVSYVVSDWRDVRVYSSLYGTLGEDEDVSYVVCDCVWGGGDVKVYSFLYDTLGEDEDVVRCV